MLRPCLVMRLFHSHLFACLHQEENVKVACGGGLCCANSTKHPDNIVIGRSRRYAVNIYLYLKFFSCHDMLFLLLCLSIICIRKIRRIYDPANKWSVCKFVTWFPNLLPICSLSAPVPIPMLCFVCPVCIHSMLEFFCCCLFLRSGISFSILLLGSIS